MNEFLVAAWLCSGVIPLLRWKFSEREVTLLDVVLCVFLGSIFGPFVPIVRGLHAVKLKGGHDGQR